MSAPVVRTVGALADDVRPAVEALAAEVSAADAATALSEDAVLRLRTGGSDVTHLLVGGPGGPGGPSGLRGYAQLVTGPHGTEGELLVAPAARRAGLGRLLLDTAVEVAAGAPTTLWSHGDTPGAVALAARTGWTRSRELLRLERPVAGLLDLEVPALPDGLVVRPFRPGADDEAWVALNAAAFATHPEQGRWTVQDLRLRLDEPWFDPAVFLVAESTTDGDAPAGALVGFCWMKSAPHAAELYVLGVAPGRGGHGLGRALLVRGLRAVATGAATPGSVAPGSDVPGSAVPGVVELYVDGDNVPAVRLYERLGFGRAAVDVQYSSPTA